jgi:rare lipoprotein A
MAKDGAGPPAIAPATSPAQGVVSDVPVKIGSPFMVAGTSYTPVDSPNYDEVGYASFYGQELAGKPTANGESFLPGGISAAHKTLPMPSYVEVTALDTGRTILLRINDRGPFADDRLIDLSEGAARQLGITGQGVSGVRVRRVNPPEQERAVLRQGLPAAERLATPLSLLTILREKLAALQRPSAALAAATAAMKAIPETKQSAVTEPAPRVAPTPQAPKPTASDAGGYVVQMAAFSSRSRAATLAQKLEANVAESADGKLFRVRYGPYASQAEAQRGLATAKARGYPQARLYRH